jgi:hypothetical protein
MKYKFQYILPLLMLIFSSCQKVIEFNGKITEPLLVINSLVTPDSVVKAQLTESRFFLSNQTTFNTVDNATITLMVNGIPKENLSLTDSGIYVGNYHPVVGDSISLLVKAQGKTDLSCGTTVVPAPTIVSIDTTSVYTGISAPIININKMTQKIDTIGYSRSRTLKIVLHFTDVPDIQNYYRLVVITKTSSIYGSYDDYYFSFDDIVSGNTNQNSVGPPTSLTSNKYNVFSDDLFNGKTYPLSFSISDNIDSYSFGNSLFSPQKEVIVKLQSISKSYYLYLQTRASTKNNNFFSEPVQVYSNVTGGIGILGSYTESIRVIKLE